LKIEIKIIIPSDDFIDDILLDFGSFCYFDFGEFIEIFPRENYPHEHMGAGVVKKDVNRRELFKIYSNYNKAARKMLEFSRKNTAN
jgi:hypothetical protein